MIKRIVTSIVIGLGGAWSPLFSQEWTDPNDASIPESFFIQGEYFGSFDQSDQRFGAHIRAAGNQYRIHFTIGGLPGSATWPMGGWSNNWNNVVNSLLTYNNGTMNISGTGVTATLNVTGNARTTSDSNKVIMGTFSGQAFTLRRVQRTSPTGGMPPVQGAIHLFDGTQSSFNTYWQNAGGGSYNSQRQAINRGVQTQNQYQSCFLHVEFLEPYMPNDENQARSNSGVYLQNRYEAQIMDSFGERGLETDSKGALYGSVPPLTNATLPPLVAWEAYDIYFMAATFNGNTKTANARFKTWLNGIKVQDGEMPGPGTGGAPEGPSAGPVFLQNHGGDPVLFKNIWIVTDPSAYPDTSLFGRCEDGTSAYVDGCTPVGVKDGIKNNHAHKAEGVILLKNGVATFVNNNEIYDVLGKKKRIEGAAGHRLHKSKSSADQ